jgi:tetratricopeptide (TPR) repeat protein
MNELTRLRVLTFSNLSYIYRDLNRYAEALKAVNYSIQLEEKLVEIDYSTSLKDIITSLLNRSAILSELNRHDKSVQSVEKALEYIKRLEEKSETSDERVQVDYLYMVSYFNLANEHETLALIDKSIENYTLASQLAQKVGNQDMVTKIRNILVGLNAAAAAKK